MDDTYGRRQKKGRHLYGLSVKPYFRWLLFGKPCKENGYGMEIQIVMSEITRKYCMYVHFCLHESHDHPRPSTTAPVLQ